MPSSACKKKYSAKPCNHALAPFFKQRVKEAVAQRAGQNLAASEPGKGHSPRLRVTHKKLAYRLAVLSRKHRARGVQHLAARCEHSPQRFQQRCLDASQLGDITGPAQPLDVRMSTYHARSRAGRVE